MELPWTEKYRPVMLKDIAGQEAIVDRFEAYVRAKSMPHLLFAGPAGSGKTTAALCIAREMFGGDISHDFLELNASVTPDTPILIKERGKITRTNFGKLAKQYFKDEVSKYAEIDSIEILTIDKNKKVKFSSIGLLSRHKVKDIAKIKYEGGFVKTSLNHSVIILDKKGNLIPKRVSDLKSRDLLIIFKDVLEGISTDLDIGKFKPYDRLKNGIIRINPRTRDILPKILLNEEMTWLFGLYLAEGCISFKKDSENSGQVIFSLGYPTETKIAERVVEIFKKYFNLPAKVEKGFSGFNRNKNSSINVKIFNTQLARFFASNFYNDNGIRNALSKRVPDFIFNTTIENKISFLRGYMGDATGNWEEFVRYSSRSYENLTDVSWLGRICGLDTSCFETEARVVWKLPKFSYIKTEFMPSEMLINLLESFDEKIDFNWRYLLRHQLYHKKSRRISKHIAKKLLENLDKKKLSQKKLKALNNILNFIDSPLSVVEIKKIDIEEYSNYVYDVSVPESEMFWGGSTPVLLHNSDERGIDIMRSKAQQKDKSANVRSLKDFARTRPIAGDFKIIFLDEADALTPEAQNALRRTMENYTRTCRFILSCNYSSKIIEPIQSRCAIFRFKIVSRDAIKKRLGEILEKEKVKFTDDGLHAIVYLSEGDMRQAVNLLQSAATIGEVNEDNVYSISTRARPEEIKNLMELAISGKFLDARNLLDKLLLNYGMSGEDVLLQMNKEVFNLGIDDATKIRIIDLVGEANFTLVEGANERIQLEALLARIMMVK